MLKAGLVQLNVSDDPARNLDATRALVAQAADGGADWVLTPEVTNLLGASPKMQASLLRTEAQDETLAALREDARHLGIWLSIGSLALKPDEVDETRFANRSFLINPMGQVVSRYDKLHMFDVTVSETESYRESASYRPGDRAVLAQGPLPVGMTICYDLRFPGLYRDLAQAGAQVLCVPAAFNDTTGAAHWETLLRARAIENGCFVLAPAQCGLHPTYLDPNRPARRSFGHSLAIDPWGQVIADGGTEPGVTMVVLDPQLVDRARSRIPSLTHDRGYARPS